MTKEQFEEIAVGGIDAMVENREALFALARLGLEAQAYTRGYAEGFEAWRLAHEDVEVRLRYALELAREYYDRSACDLCGGVHACIKCGEFEGAFAIIGLPVKE